MESTPTVLQKRQSDFDAETIVKIFHFCGGYLVEQTIVGTDTISWHLDDEHQRQLLVASLKGNGFQVTEGLTFIERLWNTIFNSSN